MEEHLRKRLPVQARSIAEDLMLIHASPPAGKHTPSVTRNFAIKDPRRLSSGKQQPTASRLIKMKNT